MFKKNKHICQYPFNITCPICNQPIRKVIYKKSFLYTPNVFIFILGRGEHNRYKVPLKIPLEIDLKNFVTEEKQKNESKYFLSTIVYFIGESGSDGHFIAVGRTDQNKNWYKYNNDEVSEFDENSLMKLLENKYYEGNFEAWPYVLLYTKTNISNNNVINNNVQNINSNQFHNINVLNNQQMLNNNIPFNNMNSVQSNFINNVSNNEYINCNDNMNIINNGNNKILNFNVNNQLNNTNENNNININNNNINNQQFLLNNNFMNNNMQHNLNNNVNNLNNQQIFFNNNQNINNLKYK